jgi:NADH dehydrogenase
LVEVAQPGVELAGELAEELPDLARRHDLAVEDCHIVLVEAGPTVLGGSSEGLVERATTILKDLGVEIRTGVPIAEATAEGFVLKGGETIRAGLCVWCGGVKVAEVVAKSGMGTGPVDACPSMPNCASLTIPKSTSQATPL